MYSHDYQDAASLTSATKIQLPSSGALSFGTISLSLDTEQRTETLSIDASYQGKTYDIYAKCAIDGFASDYFGIVVNGDISETYEYAEGKNAYFITIRNDDFSSVYFSEDGFLFSMDYETPEEKEIIKEIIHCMAD